MLSEIAFKDPSYVPNDDRYFTVEAPKRALLLIPSLQLTQLFNYIIKESGIVGFGFDKRMWERNGWLIKSKEGVYTQRDTFHISVTRPRSECREYYYAIVLNEK